MHVQVLDPIMETKLDIEELDWIKTSLKFKEKD